jgi:nicotinamide mononucleotide transporter
MNTFLQLWGYSLTYLETFAFIFTLLCVYFDTTENIWAWPIGIIGITFYMILFFNFRLYGDFSLQFIFIAFSLYGWYEWLFGGEKRSVLLVSNITKRQTLISIFSLILGYPLLGWFLKHYTDTDVPYFDAFPTIISILAQWLLARKVIQNWHLWILADIVYVGLYLYKHLYLSAFLYAVFIPLCIWGLMKWQRSRTVVGN